MAPFPTVYSPLSQKNRSFTQNLKFSHGQDGRGKKTTFSIADSVDSSVAVFGDLIEYSGSGIVNISITPILSRHFTGLFRVKCFTFFSRPTSFLQKSS